jgi:hypothetical protein
LKWTSIVALVTDFSYRQPSRGRIDTTEMLDSPHLATTIPASVLNDAVWRSTGGAVVRGAVDVDLGSGSADGLLVFVLVGLGVDVGVRVADGDGVTDVVGVPVGVSVVVSEAAGESTITRSAAEAGPTPLPALLTTKKVIAPTAPTTANQPSTITRSGRRPILTTFGLFLL